MNIEITDEKLSKLVDAEVRRYVGNRIENVMNNGEAHWFTQQTIKSITYECILKKIDDSIVKQCIKELDKKVVMEAIVGAVTKEIEEFLFDR